MIELVKVGKTFQSADETQVEAIENVDLKIKDSEFISILGPSGCGKSTLLNIMVGLEAPTTGEVYVDGKSLSELGLTGWAGYMTQFNSLCPWRTVIENVTLGLEIRKIPKKDQNQIAKEYLHRGGLEGFEHKRLDEISGGMLKRVDLARVLAYDPRFLFLDEPFGALDVQTKEFLQEDLLKIWEGSNKTVVFVTHDISEAIILSDRVIVMSYRPSQIKSEYVIDLPRPRKVKELLNKDPRYMEFYHHIREDLSSEMIKAKEVSYHG